MYISYDGMLEPLGQSQVLAYLERLASGRQIHLISYEKTRDWRDSVRRVSTARRISEAGIRWHPLRYHKSPTALATAYDVAVGTALAIALAWRHKLNIVHARSYVAALIALGVKRASGAKFLFDMRGLWADERVDGGLWPANGWLYRTSKSLERRFLKAADRVITLTHASEEEIRRFEYLRDNAPPISVIPTCADLDRFTIERPPASDPFVLGYVGSVGTWYQLDDMLRCFNYLKELESDAQLLVVNRDEKEHILDSASALGIDLSAIEIVAADHREMPRLIGRMSAGMALIKPLYSKIASAPTKLAEYLGCGVPVLGNEGVGDMAAILNGRRVGVAVSDLSEPALREGIGRLVGLSREQGLQERCRQVALELFTLERGAARYAEAYQELLEGQR
ncbi:glycosyltransferase [Sphingomonas sp. G124]|uniref:Glycosyltransferase n=1 Tax=Sphingomonas cremea TaxID=2904799 RepID=A0A9X1TXZ7_9SPHN|nr:glycosyltransferase [Sphingomonas cremea]MCF2514327.1 glycosyltransferase [Sphingomonas cremea]